jgi:KipI family sensor histidine kinase inhibitor
MTSVPVVVSAGDTAVLIELEPRIDPIVNARAIAIADHVRAQRLPGVRDVVSTFRSVAVHFDPLMTEPVLMMSALTSAAEMTGPVTTGRRIEVSVAYGGAHGPDLADLARYASLSEDEVVGLHTGIEYRVYVLGFVPGFGYMASVDPRIAMPRRATPRLAVPEGSVGIAGRQTGIYPRETPGGWQIIGCTDLELFDPSGNAAPLLRPGDTVRFTRTRKALAPKASRRFPEDLPGTSRRLVTVLAPGLLTTVQDLGRWGHQDVGVSVSGAMDTMAHRLANICVGNAEGTATLEVTIAGPTLRLESAAILAVTGADLSATLDGAPITMNAPIAARAGATLRFGDRRYGARAYLAFDGGIDTRPVLGSRATHLPTRMGGMNGRALRAGDRIPLGTTRASAHTPRIAPPPARPVSLRLIPGPDTHSRTQLDRLIATRFMVSTQSNRMGYRLVAHTDQTATFAGDAADVEEAISEAVVAGSVQIPPSGAPMLLMADRHTIGGYPQIATIISADLPFAGQLAPGDAVRFALCTPSEAHAALMAQEEWFRAVH